MASLGMIASAIGTAVSVVGTLAGGAQQRARYEYEAKVQEQQADEAMAASQRDAAARYREGALIASQQRAGIAAGGGSLADPGVIDLMGDTREQVGLAAQTEIYKGEMQAKGYNDAAAISRIDAKNSMTNAWLTAGGQLFSGISNMYSRFGQPQAGGGTAAGSTAPLFG